MSSAVKTKEPTPLPGRSGSTEVDELSNFQPRLAGTDVERRAANDLAARWKSPGRKVRVEPLYIRPQDGLVHMLHCLLGVTGALLGQVTPRVGFALVFLTAVSLYLDLNGRFYLLRRLLFRRASQNVVARESKPDAPARVVVISSYGAERTGFLFSSKIGRRFFTGPMLGPIPITIWRIIFISLVVLLPTLVLIDVGVADDTVALVQLPSIFALLIAAFALGEVELSEGSPSANTNSSGVEGSRQVQSILNEQPPKNLELWTVALGGGVATLESARAFLADHAAELADRPTHVINLESIGRGTPRWVESSGATITVHHDPALREICRLLAEGVDDPEMAPRPIRTGLRSPSNLTTLAGLASVTITTREANDPLPPDYRTPSDLAEKVDPASIGAAAKFTADVIRLLDRDAGRS